MTLRSKLAYLRQECLSSIHSRPIVLGNQVPVVSFCFDDFPQSAYTIGGAILKSFGAQGTYYVAPGLMNSVNDLGLQFNQDDIYSLLADGHEIGCHTFAHISCRSVQLSDFRSDVRKGRDSIREMTGCEAINFAYPYGHVTLNAKKTIGAEMSSCRGIFGGVNSQTADLNLLRANSLYGDVDSLSKVEVLLSENEERGGWLIFYTHDVRPNPSVFGCTPALLDNCLSLAHKKGFRIASVREVIAIAQGVAHRTTPSTSLKDRQRAPTN